MSLGLTVQPSVPLVLDRLAEWRATASDPSAEDEPRFCTTIAHMSAVYVYLARHLAQEYDTITAALAGTRSIFVPNVPSDPLALVRAQGPAAAAAPGAWYGPTDVCAGDPSGALDPSAPVQALDILYSPAAVRAVQALLPDMPETPTAAQYVACAAAVAAAKDVPAGLEQVLELLGAAAELWEAEGGGSPDSVLPSDARCLPTVAGQWVGRGEGPLLNDAPGLVERFQGLQAASCPRPVHILSLPVSGPLADLLEALGVRRASATIRHHIIAADALPDTPVAPLLVFALPYAQRWLRDRRPSAYAALQEGDAAARLLLRLRCAEVRELRYEWHLEGVPSVSAAQVRSVRQSVCAGGLSRGRAHRFCLG